MTLIDSTVTMTGLSMTNITGIAAFGGALLLETSISQLEPRSASISDSKLNTCNAKYGGAIGAKNMHLTIVNSEFSQNSATSAGGALQLNCTFITGCTTSIDQSSKFIENTADAQGGAINFDYYPPTVDLT